MKIFDFLKPKKCKNCKYWEQFGERGFHHCLNFDSYKWTRKRVKENDCCRLWERRR